MNTYYISVSVEVQAENYEDANSMADEITNHIDATFESDLGEIKTTLWHEVECDDGNDETFD